MIITTKNTWASGDITWYQ